jgi:hypothetical protein
MTMTFRYRLRNPDTIMRVGLVCLVIASLSRWFLHPAATVVGNLVEGMTGVMFGLSIGCLLLAARLNGRRRRGEENRPCT